MRAIIINCLKELYMENRIKSKKKVNIDLSKVLSFAECCSTVNEPNGLKKKTP